MASHSCDIAFHNFGTDPHVELIVARKIKQIDGNFTFNKNPRTLHINLSSKNPQSGIESIFLDLKAHQKLAIPKNSLLNRTPDPDRELDQADVKILRDWLAARYSRPTFPTDFNNLIEESGAAKILRGKAKKNNSTFSGIYAEILPDAELKPGQAYQVNLIGAIPVSSDNTSRSKAEEAIKACAEALRISGMNVEARVMSENEISLALIRRFKRFYFDDLSFREAAVKPIETHINI